MTSFAKNVEHGDCRCNAGSICQENISTFPAKTVQRLTFSHPSSIQIALQHEINSADVLESLGWQTLEERRKRNKSILMYRILNNCAAPILKEQFTRSGDLPENYNLRSRRTDLILPSPKRDYLKKA